MSNSSSTFIPLSDLTGGTKKEKPDWITGTINTKIGPVNQISTEWNQADKNGQIKARLNNKFRMKYMVLSGLYAVGDPNENSPILLSANYKLSFDILRRELKDLNCWVVVLDTKGINVWCAAGKGTFGTEEIIKKINYLKLDQLVKHHKVISPQLGAPGIKAHEVKKSTGFRIEYGPVVAKDISQYLQNGLKATKEMRQISFNMIDRLILTPMEISLVLAKSWKYIIGILIFFGIMPTGILFKNALVEGIPFVLLLLTSVLMGAFFTPLLLPWIPFRSFFKKGFLMGLVPVVLAHYFSYQIRGNTFDPYLMASLYFLIPTLSSYLAFNFTGCTTFTNPAGVNKELKTAIVFYAITLVVGCILLIIYKLRIWGVI
jgi:hypothetical protein